MKSERGQSLVELAISIVILLYLLSGAVEFGILFFQYVQLRDAAQEGALYGSIHPDDEALIIERIVTSSGSPLALEDLYDAGELTIDITVRDHDNPATIKTVPADYCEGDALEIVVSYTHEIVLPFIPRDSIDLDATVTDTILTPVCP